MTIPLVGQETAAVTQGIAALVGQVAQAIALRHVGEMAYSEFGDATRADDIRQIVRHAVTDAIVLVTEMGHQNNAIVTFAKQSVSLFVARA